VSPQSATVAVSVVVATRNRFERLVNLLRALQRQTIDPTRFELVIVDDGSTDDTPRLLRSTAERLPFTTTVLDGAGNGPAAARNRGWARAAGDLVAFTDDDCEPTPRWLEAGLEAATTTRETIVQGPTSPIPDERDRLGPFARTKSIEELGPWFQTCNMFYPRELLVRLDGFDERFTGPFGEDADLAWRALASGASTVFAAQARVHHAVEARGAIDFVRSGLRDPDEALVFKRHPELRRAVSRWPAFKADSHALLAMACFGILLARSQRPFLLLAAPYARLLVARARAVGASPPQIAALVGFDVLETASATRGSLRHRVWAL
jgi:GT2 family glycosyltransferase